MSILKSYVRELGTISNYIRSIARLLTEENPDISVLCTKAVVVLGEASDKMEMRAIQAGRDAKRGTANLARVNASRAALAGGAVMHCPFCGAVENPLDVITGLCKCQEPAHELLARARLEAARGSRRHDPVPGDTPVCPPAQEAS